MYVGYNRAAIDGVMKVEKGSNRVCCLLSNTSTAHF